MRLQAVKIELARADKLLMEGATPYKLISAAKAAIYKRARANTLEACVRVLHIDEAR